MQLLPVVRGTGHGPEVWVVASRWGRIRAGVGSNDLSNPKSWLSKCQVGPQHPRAIKRHSASWERYCCGGDGEERKMMENKAMKAPSLGPKVPKR